MYMYVLPLILVESGLATKNVYSYNKMYLLLLQEIDSGLAKKYMYLPSLQRDSCITKNTWIFSQYRYCSFWISDTITCRISWIIISFDVKSRYKDYYQYNTKHKKTCLCMYSPASQMYSEKAKTGSYTCNCIFPMVTFKISLTCNTKSTFILYQYNRDLQLHVCNVFTDIFSHYRLYSAIIYICLQVNCKFMCFPFDRWNTTTVNPV